MPGNVPGTEFANIASVSLDLVFLLTNKSIILVSPLTKLFPIP